MGEEVLTSALLLGLDVVDVCVRAGDGSWQVKATRQVTRGVQLPDPNGPIGCVGPGRDGGIRHFISGRSPSVDDHLARVRLGAIISSALGAETTSTVVLRGGVTPRRPLTATLVDCFELLAGNATIALQNKRLVGELRAMQAKLHHQAYHDPLTELSNRTRFVDEVERKLRVHEASGTSCWSR